MLNLSVCSLDTRIWEAKVDCRACMSPVAGRAVGPEKGSGLVKKQWYPNLIKGPELYHQASMSMILNKSFRFTKTPYEKDKTVQIEKYIPKKLLVSSKHEANHYFGHAQFAISVAKWLNETLEHWDEHERFMRHTELQNSVRNSNLKAMIFLVPWCCSIVYSHITTDEMRDNIQRNNTNVVGSSGNDFKQLVSLNTCKVQLKFNRKIYHRKDGVR